MEDKKNINDAISEINELVSEGALQNLSDDQLSKVSEMIDEIQKMLEK